MSSQKSAFQNQLQQPAGIRKAIFLYMHPSISGFILRTSTARTFLFRLVKMSLPLLPVCCSLPSLNIYVLKTSFGSLSTGEAGAISGDIFIISFLYKA
jgi:hypothetical protein